MGVPLINYTKALFYSRRFAESNMRSSVVVVRKMPPVFNDVTGELSSGAPTTIYSGKARIYPATGPVRYAIGDEPQRFSAATVSIPAATTDIPAVDDLVLIVSHPGDVALNGRIFAVVDVEAGGQFMASRRLQVVGVQESPQWPVITELNTSTGTASATGGVTVFGGTP